jgi:hypothetical protein
VNEKLVFQEKLFRGLGPQMEGQLKQGVELPDVRQIVATAKCNVDAHRKLTISAH